MLFTDLVHGEFASATKRAFSVDVKRSSYDRSCERFSPLRSFRESCWKRAVDCGCCRGGTVPFSYRNTYIDAYICTCVHVCALASGRDLLSFKIPSLIIEKLNIYVFVFFFWFQICKFVLFYLFTRRVVVHHFSGLQNQYKSTSAVYMLDNHAMHVCVCVHVKLLKSEK